MPQKLIRLTCESNDGVFDGLFDQDIHIKQDSDIAFQSLTLERQSTSFNVNNSNNEIVFQSRDGAGLQTTYIDNKTYQEEDRFELMKSIQTNLNEVCDMMTAPRQMNVQWKVEIDEDLDLVDIECRPSPFFPLSNWNARTGAAIFNTESAIGASVTAGVPNAEEPFQGLAGFGRFTQSAAGALNECYMYSEMSFIKSTGSFRIRLSDMTVGTANRPSFTMGLVDSAGLAKLANATIVMSDLVYAIQVDERSAAIDTTTGGYSYINEPGFATTTPTLPFVKIENCTLGTLTENDVFEIVLRNGVLQGFIHQETAGLLPQPASTTKYNNTRLYPVVFCHLANTANPDPLVNNLVDMIQCSFDPFHYSAPSIPGYDPWLDFLNDNQSIEPDISTLTTLVEYEVDVRIFPFRPNFGFGSFDIAEYLGFTNVDLTTSGESGIRIGLGATLFTPNAYNGLDPNTNIAYGPIPQGFSLTAKNVFTAAIDVDNYILDTQTFMLDSYDSYGLSIEERNANAGGSRRNLLATIPVTETIITNSINARVIYEPNTLDYIAIKNRSDVITRQIRMRLLNSRYEPITTAGLAAITILIREPYTN